MSDVEMAVGFFSLLVGGSVWILWFRALATVDRLVSRGGGRVLLIVVPLVCFIALFAVLKAWSARDVRNDPIYLAFYLVLGINWVGAAIGLFALCGVSARDDVLERRNRAAAYCLSGVLVGFTLSFAGGNIGGGPDWTELFAALLATGGVFVLVIVMQLLTDAIETITVGRDEAAGVRVGGLVAAAGLVLGRSVAGTWQNVPATLADFARFGWPVLILFVVAVIVERRFRPTGSRPAFSVLSHGVAPAAAYVVAAGAYVLSLGWWK